MTKRYLLSLLAAFLLGIYARSLYQDSLELVALNAAVTAQENASKYEFDQAVALQDWLAENARNKETVIREVVKLVDRPVYHNVCLDDDGLRIANAAKNGTAIERADGVPDPR